MILVGLVCFLSYKYIHPTYHNTAKQILATITNEEPTGEQLGKVIEKLESASDNTFQAEVLLHGTLAILVALILIFAVEAQAGLRNRREIERYRDKVARGVWDAIFDRTIPRKIVEELNGIFKSEFVKRGCRYKITIREPYEGIDTSRYILLTKEMSCDVVNITHREKSYRLSTSLWSSLSLQQCKDQQGNDISVPRIVEIKVDNEQIAVDKNAGAFKVKQGKFGVFEHTTKEIEPGASARVYMETEHVCAMQDYMILTQKTPIETLEVQLINQIDDRIKIEGCILNHPKGHLFRSQVRLTVRVDADRLLPVNSLCPSNDVGRLTHINLSPAQRNCELRQLT